LLHNVNTANKDMVTHTVVFTITDQIKNTLCRFSPVALQHTQIESIVMKTEATE